MTWNMDKKEIFFDEWAKVRRNTIRSGGRASRKQKKKEDKRGNERFMRAGNELSWKCRRGELLIYKEKDLLGVCSLPGKRKKHC
jgi:hypothetical protein